MKNSVVTKYYFAGSTRLAVRTNGTLSYLLGDHIGSSSVTTDANGAKTASALYKAFGETRYTLGNLGTDYKFTGQREQAELGIYWFQSRWMDPSLGRFTSPDTIVPTSTQGTQAWDRYAYVNNNPVRYNDPTGHGVDCGIGESCYGSETNPNDPPAPPPPLQDDPNDPKRDHPANNFGRSEQADCLPGNLVACFYNGGVMPSGDYNISFWEYLMLLLAIGYDIDQQGPIENYANRDIYDTPFYNLGGVGGGNEPLTGTICIGGVVCRTRTELNYIGQGAWSAGAMESEGLMTVELHGWKFVSYGRLASSGTVRSAKDAYVIYMISHPGKWATTEIGISNPFSLIDYLLGGR